MGASILTRAVLFFSFCMLCGARPASRFMLVSCMLALLRVAHSKQRNPVEVLCLRHTRTRSSKCFAA